MLPRVRTSGINNMYSFNKVGTDILEWNIGKEELQNQLILNQLGLC